MDGNFLYIIKNSQKHSMSNLKSEFLKKSKLIHGDTYDYSLVDYKNKRTKVKIICNEHGIFEQLPQHHTIGNGCKPCSDDRKRLTIEKFIERANKVHNNKYDYSLVKYTGAHNKVKILCPIHGKFEQRSCDHINSYNRGCPDCGGTQKSTTEEFILKSKEIHGDKYDYSLVEYTLCTNKVKIVCFEHGIFEQLAHIHLSGCGCPCCNNSKGELKIVNFLDTNNIVFEPQKRFDECRNILPLPFDFYLPTYNICIEFDGEQHFKNKKMWGGREGLLKRQQHDNIKTQYCQNNNINLIRINYNENIIEKLKEIYGNTII